MEDRTQARRNAMPSERRQPAQRSEVRRPDTSREAQAEARKARARGRGRREA